MRAAIEPEVVTSTLEEEYGLSIKRKSPTRALATRLVDGTLRPAEQAQLDRTREIRARQQRGETTLQIAAALKMTPQNLRSYMAGQHFRVTMRYLAEQDAKPSEVVAFDRRATERAEWNALAPRALEFYRRAFAVDAKGNYVNADRAERAAKLLADGQGWTAPEPTAVRQQALKPGVIQAQMHAIAATDRGETVVRVQVEVASREGDHPGEL